MLVRPESNSRPPASPSSTTEPPVRGSSDMDKGLLNGVLFIDLKKAFDTDDHVILIGKLKSLGLSNNNLERFHSYLSSHYQKTVIGQASSTSQKVSLGVPQGSIFGP